ncbi:E3 ubiquitin ligase [Coemansia sp. RSA 1836]|nr:E3 ubiquitin ligase [Coemansia sp. RSA 1836]
MAAASGPDPSDRKSSSIGESSTLAGQAPGPSPGPSARTGLSMSQAGPVGPCPEGRDSLEADGAPLSSTDFLGCFGVTNALDPPTPLRLSYYPASASSSSTSTPTRPDFPDVSHHTDGASDESSYDADSDESSDESSHGNIDSAHDSTVEDGYEMPNEFVDDFVRLNAKERQGERSPSLDVVSRSEFDSMRLEYLERLVEQTEEAGVSREKASALSAELLVQRSELQAAADRLVRIANVLQCSICLETFAQPHSLACGHIFCQECLVQWLVQSLKCPTCRAHVPIRPAPAYAIKEVINLVDPSASIATSTAPALQSSGEAVDPWARLFPVRQRLSIPSIPSLNIDPLRRTPGVETGRHGAAARSVGTGNELAVLNAVYFDMLEQLRYRLQQLENSRSELYLEAALAFPPIDAPAPHLVTSEPTTAAPVPAPALPSTEGVRRGALYVLILRAILAMGRQVDQHQELVFHLNSPPLDGILTEGTHVLLRRIAEHGINHVFDAARRPPSLGSEGAPTPTPPPLPRLHPHLQRTPAGPISSTSSSSPRIPIPPPRERPAIRPVTRPVRMALNDAHASSSSANDPTPPQSRLRQPTRFVRPAGIPAAATVAAASGSSSRNPIRISHIMGNSGSNSHGNAAQTTAEHTPNRDHARNRALLTMNQYLVHAIYRLLLVYQRLREPNALETPQSAADRAIGPARREARMLDLIGRRLFPSDDPTDEPATSGTSAPRAPTRPRMPTESARPIVRGSGGSATRDSDVLPRHSYRPEEPTTNESMLARGISHEVIQALRRSQQARARMARPPIRVGARGASPNSLVAPIPTLRQVMLSRDSEPEDMVVDMSEPD